MRLRWGSGPLAPDRVAMRSAPPRPGLGSPASACPTSPRAAALVRHPPVVARKARRESSDARPVTSLVMVVSSVMSLRPQGKGGSTWRHQMSHSVLCDRAANESLAYTRYWDQERRIHSVLHRAGA